MSKEKVDELKKLKHKMYITHNTTTIVQLLYAITEYIIEGEEQISDMEQACDSVDSEAEFNHGYAKGKKDILDSINSIFAHELKYQLRP